MEWISVKDKVPPNGEMILACDMMADLLVGAYYVAWVVDGRQYGMNRPSAPMGFTHWMQIPPPPQGETK